LGIGVLRKQEPAVSRTTMYGNLGLFQEKAGADERKSENMAKSPQLQAHQL